MSSADGWHPRAHVDRLAGSPLWTVERYTVSVARAKNAKVFELGVGEFLLLETLDGGHTIPEAVALIEEQTGSQLADTFVSRTINKFILNDLVERPFASELPSARNANEETSSPAADPNSTYLDNGAARTSWNKIWSVADDRIGRIFLVFLFVAGALSLPLGMFLGLPALGVLFRSLTSPMGLILALPIAVVWQVLVTAGHEFSHGVAFRNFSGLTPRIALTKIGLLTFPATHLDGFALIPSKTARLAVVLAGPAFSSACALLPLALLRFSPVEFIVAQATVCWLVTSLVVVVGLIPFPNTDGCRALEVLTGTRSLPESSAKARASRGTLLPRSLSRMTRFVVRWYRLVIVIAGLLVLVVVTPVAFL